MDILALWLIDIDILYLQTNTLIGLPALGHCLVTNTQQSISLVIRSGGGGLTADALSRSCLYTVIQLPIWRLFFSSLNQMRNVSLLYLLSLSVLLVSFTVNLIQLMLVCPLKWKITWQINNRQWRSQIFWKL